MTADPMFVPELPSRWTVVGREQSRSKASLRLEASGSRSLEVTLSRTLASALRDAYPVSSHDVRIEVSAEGLPGLELQQLLRDLVGGVEVGDPQCRRVVYAVPASDLASIAVGEAAGFRFVVEVDVADESLALLVAEPDWVTRVDMDLDRIPGS